MSVRQAMSYRALVQRDTGGGTDPDGGPLPPSWTTHIASLPCYLWADAEVEAVSADRTAVVTDWRMVAPKGTDVTERDRVAEVRNRIGAVIMARPMQVRTVMPRPDHLELQLQAVAP